MIDSRGARSVPHWVQADLNNVLKGEISRTCYEHEKAMARCTQDKQWTLWKCQRERDAYYRCLRDEKKKNAAQRLSDIHWKYCLGTYGGEYSGRKKLMQALWKEYFPDRSIPHEWASEE